MLPEAVLEEVQAEILNYQGSGMSVMEMSHRSKVFEEILHEAEKDLRELMQIPDNYKILFIQGGGTLQFAMVPMNLMKTGVADYVYTGAWSKKAISEAKKFGKVNVDQSPILTLRYQVFGLPTTLIFKDGQIVERLSGNVSVVQLQQKIQSYL